jgi:cell wall-associated NlpC family hydrolase
MRTARKVLYISTLVFLSVLSIFNPGITSAITQDDVNSITNGTPFFDPDALQCGNTSTSSGGSTVVQGPDAWNSTVQPPYYLESFVINVLEDIAQVAKVPQTDTVTQEHVVALVSWAWEEGGNITNTDIFNPWNTGLDDPDLIAGGAADNGVQSFKSFDAGVTAATITMTGSYQNRLEKALTDPSSTAEQFMDALTYYQQYPGNQFWAQADQEDQPAYNALLMNVLSQTRSNYDQRASVEIGPGEEGTNHVPTSELVYQGGNANPTGGSSSGTSTGGGCQTTLTTSVTCNNNSTGAATSSVIGNTDSAIACQVVNYKPLLYSQAWHESGSAFHAECDTAYGYNPSTTTSTAKTGPTSLVFAPAEGTKYAVGPSCATDCSGLVDIALYDLFGTDIDWNTYEMIADAKGARTDFEEVPYSQVEPGDLIFPAQYNGDHVEIIEQKVGNEMATFGAHTDAAGTPPDKEVGPVPAGPGGYQDVSGNIYLRYIGKGSSFAGS